MIENLSYLEKEIKALFFASMMKKLTLKLLLHFQMEEFRQALPLTFDLK